MNSFLLSKDYFLVQRYKKYFNCVQNRVKKMLFVGKKLFVVIFLGIFALSAYI